MNKTEKREFYRELGALAIPVGLQNLLAALIGATDALMLGRLTQDSVSAVSLANQIAFIMSMFYGAVVGGGGALIAQYWGKGDREMVRNLFSTILKYAFGVSVVFFAAAFLAPRTLMRIYTSDAALIEIGANYLRIVSFSYLFTGLTQCYFLMMKIEGHASRSVLISVVTLLVDMSADVFLIYGFGSFRGFGANGSAYSTVAVEAIALIWCVAESRRPQRMHPTKKSLAWFSAPMTKELLKISAPMLASSLTWGVGFSMRSLIMGHLGSDATAAASITSVAQELITCLCKGVSAGAGVMIGKLLGQSLFDKAKAYGRAFCKLSFVTGLICAALICAVTPLVVKFFVLSEAAREYLVAMLLFSALYLVAYCFNSIIVCGVFPAGGDARYDAVSVFFSMWCFSLPLALLGAFVFHWPVMVVYILMCADEIVKLPWLYPRYKKYLWVRNLTQPH